MKTLQEMQENIFSQSRNLLAPSENPPVKPDMISLGELEKTRFKNNWWQNTGGSLLKRSVKAYEAIAPQFLGNSMRVLGGVLGKDKKKMDEAPIYLDRFGIAGVGLHELSKKSEGMTAFNQKVHDRLNQFGEFLDFHGGHIVKWNQEYLNDKYGTPQNRVEQFFGDVGEAVVSAGSAVLMVSLGGGPLVYTMFGLTEMGSKYSELIDADASIDKALLVQYCYGMQRRGGLREGFWVLY